MARYTSTNELLTWYMETHESKLKSARRRASLDVWARQLGIFHGLDVLGKVGFSLTVADGRHLLNG